MGPVGIGIPVGADISSVVREAIAEFGEIEEIPEFPIGQIEAEVLFVGLSRQISADFLLRMPRLRLIVTATTGLQHIDVGFCESNKITVLSLRNQPSEIRNVTSTTELAVGLAIELVRRVSHALTSVLVSDVWDRRQFVGRQLSSLTIGLLGFGRIGQGVGRVFEALGSQVIWYDPDTKESVLTPGKPVNRDELFARADLLSIHVSPEVSHPVITKEEISLMRRGSFLVNTARGHLVDEEAVAEALRDRTLGGYAADVLSGEQESGWSPSKSELVGLAREGFPVVITPHIGGCTSDAMDQTGLIMVEQAREWWRINVRNV